MPIFEMEYSFEERRTVEIKAKDAYEAGVILSELSRTLYEKAFRVERISRNDRHLDYWQDTRFRTGMSKKPEFENLPNLWGYTNPNTVSASFLEFLTENEFHDASWKNDQCAKMEQAWNSVDLETTNRLRLWIDHVNPLEREEEDLPRFIVFDGQTGEYEAAETEIKARTILSRLLKQHETV